MELLVKEVKRRLRREDCGHLSVHRGRGKSYRWLEIHRRNPGEQLSEKEEKAICRVLDQPYQGRRCNAETMLAIEASMKMGLRTKEPVCSVCGNICKDEKEVEQCMLSH